MSRSRIWFCATGMLLCWGWCVGTAAQEGRTSEATDVEDISALIEAGKAAMKDLKPLSPGERQETYFRIMFGPDDAVGYVISAIEAAKRGSETVYLYSTETTMTFPNKAKMSVLLTATLRPTFEPLDLVFKQRSFKPRESETNWGLQLVAGKDKIKITLESGDQSTINEVPRPKDPLIFGIEMMVQRLDIETHTEFIVRELDVQSGNAGELKFTMDKMPDSSPTIITFDAGGTPSYQFWFDRRGELVRWGQPSMPVLFIRTTKERVMQLKATLGPDAK